MFIISVAFVCRAGVVRGVLGGLGGLGFEILGSFKRGASTGVLLRSIFPASNLIRQRFRAAAFIHHVPAGNWHARHQHADRIHC